MRIKRLQEPAAFTAFVLLIFLTAAWSLRHQGQVYPKNVHLDAAPSFQTMPTTRQLGSRQNNRVHVVQIFDAGSLQVSKPRPVREKPVRQQKVGTPPKLAQQGNWPTIDADYSSIGFDGFLDIVDRLGGRFFLLTHNGLGPEVSLRDSTILGPNVEPGLAVSRPYLVTDEEVARRLRSLPLPRGAKRGSVVLLLSGWFDAMLWREIDRAVTQAGQSLSSVAVIQARYVQSPSGTYLALGRMRVRSKQGVVELKKLIRLPL